jgi:hypothetical protein
MQVSSQFTDISARRAAKWLLRGRFQAQAQDSLLITSRRLQEIDGPLSGRDHCVRKARCRTLEAIAAAGAPSDLLERRPDVLRFRKPPPRRWLPYSRSTHRDVAATDTCAPALALTADPLTNPDPAAFEQRRR